MTDMPATDERLHRDAIAGLLSPALSGHVYDYGKVPGETGNSGTLPRIFALLILGRRPFDGPRRAGRAGSGAWRVRVWWIGSTVDEARWAQQRVTDAIDEQRITVDGHVSTPLIYETGEPIRPDDGQFSGAGDWVYII